MPESILAALKDDTPRKDDRQVLSFQFQGYLIQVGQNSYSNERLVKDHPHRNCLWLHAMAARGSHVILCTHGRDEPSSDVLQHAASLALKFSHSQARTVSMSFLKDMTKPDNMGVGVFKSSKSVALEVV